ncbi:redoxin domain-containing protein [Pseudodesulfovibrio sp. JC047]|nr:redoxin domain-containing protein [Pseudodesulfovibrio sp. JC047]
MRGQCWIITGVLGLCVGLLLFSPAVAAEMTTYSTGMLQPRDSVLQVAVGDVAPDFELPSIAGTPVRLSDYRGSRNVVLTFVPAAWTPVCSDQWPGYRLAIDLFKANNAELIGITVDNTPTQKAWVDAMGGLNFPVVSDFWPHGNVASAYGILRSDGVAERAVFIVDTKGVIRFIHVEDINKRPDLGMLVKALEAVNAKECLLGGQGFVPAVKQLGVPGDSHGFKDRFEIAGQTR